MIRAPIAGEIQRKSVNNGAYVEAATPVLTIVDNNRLELECSVASADLAPIRSGQRVTFSVNSYPGLAFEDGVVQINPAVDEQTRAARLRIQVVNAGRKLKAGMFAQGEILTGVDASAIVVPAALQRENLDVPAGKLEQGRQEPLVRVAGKFRSLDAFDRVIVASRGGSPIYLPQVARVVDGIEDRRSASLIDGRSGLSLDVVKQSGANTVEVADAIDKTWRR